MRVCVCVSQATRTFHKKTPRWNPPCAPCATELGERREREREEKSENKRARARARARAKDRARASTCERLRLLSLALCFGGGAVIDKATSDRRSVIEVNMYNALSGNTACGHSRPSI
jgi:hypothetical protein